MLSGEAFKGESNGAICFALFFSKSNAYFTEVWKGVFGENAEFLHTHLF